jgi:hypothetical protein
VEGKLGALIGLSTYSVKLGKESDWTKGKAANGMFSISETRLGHLSASDRVKLRRHNMVHLTRIYPKGLRFGSSNYDPSLGWNTGCQLVALNWQTWDLGMQQLRAFFSMNGNCGYVLKPRWMLGDPCIATESQPLRFVVRLYRGGLLPSQKGDKIDPYVVVRVCGWDSDEFRTKAVQDNGFDPEWNEGHEFSLADPDLDVIQFELKDKDTLVDDRIAFGAMPVKGMRTGFRWVQLREPKEGKEIAGAFLMCFFKLCQ